MELKVDTILEEKKEDMIFEEDEQSEKNLMNIEDKRRDSKITAIKKAEGLSMNVIVSIGYLELDI